MRLELVLQKDKYMRIAALLPLISFFIFIALGVIVYSKNPKDAFEL